MLYIQEVLFIFSLGIYHKYGKTTEQKSHIWSEKKQKFQYWKEKQRKRAIITGNLRGLARKKIN